MAKSNFGGGAYALTSPDLAAQTAVNVFMEPREDGSGEFAFMGTPGLARVATIGSGGHRQSIVAGGSLFCVVGASVYRINSIYTATLLGTLPNSTGPVAMAENGIQVAVAHPGGWHVIVLATGVMSAVANSPTTSDVSFIDNYGVFAKADGSYGWTNLADFATLGTLSFASAEGAPDPVLRTIADHREIWWMGTNSIEIGVVSGEADLPFTRTAFIEQGILAPQSACKIDNSVFWLGRNEKGQGIVYRANGYTPTRVSTFGIEQAIRGYSSPQTASAYTYQQDGHHYYVLNFAEASWAFDINVGVWHRRAYKDVVTGDLQRHRAETHAMFNGQHVVGDYADGRLYRLDPDTFTDDGDSIYRERAWMQIEEEGQWIVFHEGQLHGQMGVGLDGLNPPNITYLTDEDGSVLTDESGTPLVVQETTLFGEHGAEPKVWLQWSDDGSMTWSNAHDRHLGRIGQYRHRCIWKRLGRSRKRTFKLWTDEPVRIAWRAFTLRMG